MFGKVSIMFGNNDIKLIKVVKFSSKVILVISFKWWY